MTVERVRRIGRGDRRAAGEMRDVLLEAHAGDAKCDGRFVARARITGFDRIGQRGLRIDHGLPQGFSIGIGGHACLQMRRVAEGCNSGRRTVAGYLENAQSESVFAQKQACRNNGFCRERAVVVSPLAKPDITAICAFSGRGGATVTLTVESISAAPW